ncbi:MAG: DegT/DnrJ/EryC1/StrS family aminotransferase [Deltaproteobacteria bacterium]|nr:DegT/DnrJ/EryC1/StrS family aminotransferase [Deltaproteobacteria bacterium]
MSLPRIRLAAPAIDARDQRAVADILASGWLSGGPTIAAFESAVADRCGVNQGVAVSSGTTALSLALDVLGVGPGDEVIVPSFTYVATAHAVALTGATCVLADVEKDTWNLNPKAANAALTSKTRAIIPVDQFGLLANLDALTRIVADHTPSALSLIEDAACALGATAPNTSEDAQDGDERRCGHAPARLACLSFHPRKIITCGEGGMILTNDQDLADRLRERRNHGRDAQGIYHGVGGNYRLSAIGAALGLAQLSRLDTFLDRRRSLAARYRDRLAPFIENGILHLQQPNPGHAYQTFALSLGGPPDAHRRDTLIRSLGDRGIESGIATTAAHQLPPYRNATSAAMLPVAEWLGCNGFSLPLHMGLSDDDVDRVCHALTACVGAKTGSSGALA